MRRITLVVLALALTSGVALADRNRWNGNRGRDRGGRVDNSNRSGGVIVRDNRDRGWRDRGRSDYRDRTNYRRVRVERRPVHVNGGRFVFHGGVSRTYVRPVIRQRYFDFRFRPQIVVESYDPVPGYIWVAGSWTWSGREWMWSSGYWAVDPNNQYNYYDSSTGQYYDSEYDSDYDSDY